MLKFLPTVLTLCSAALFLMGCTETSELPSPVDEPISSTDQEPSTPICGNGVVEEGEDCDDGNTLSEACDYGELDCVVCRDDCSEGAGATSYCGDGIINGAEVCDDGSGIIDFSPTNPCAFECSVVLSEIDCAGYYIHPTNGPIHTLDLCGECDEIEWNDCTLVDNGDGTNLDTSSGLTWMKCSLGMSFNALNNACEGDYSTFQFCSNQTGCLEGISDLLIGPSTTSAAWNSCRDLSYAGHTNWRVPTLTELQGITRDSFGSAAQINGAAFTNIPLVDHWSSDVHDVGVGHSYGWSVDLGSGDRHSRPSWESNAVLCVRDDSVEISCTDTCYDYDEAITPSGPNTCSTDCQCDGARTCSDLGYCQGMAGGCGEPDVSISCTDPCYDYEESFTFPDTGGLCDNDCECDGARTCWGGLVCQGDAGICENDDSSNDTSDFVTCAEMKDGLHNACIADIRLCEFECGDDSECDLNSCSDNFWICKDALSVGGSAESTALFDAYWSCFQDNGAVCNSEGTAAQSDCLATCVNGEEECFNICLSVFHQAFDLCIDENCATEDAACVGND